eukprot:11560118-Alexandrium_andersonii.AAC.1
MSASLVGSEMCIRDSSKRCDPLAVAPSAGPIEEEVLPRGSGAGAARSWGSEPKEQWHDTADARTGGH